MTDLYKIAKRVLRAIEAGETNQDIFVWDARALAESAAEREDRCEKHLGNLTDAELMKLVDFINEEKLKKEREA
ncbi:hypothetical protein Megvenef_00351 [Candidatus Megaera venefica]|uniref:Uncharacterized protein n=1 Tax=Candidatus Megaera venefica TaxID=2055910 RepID=A0ABU5NB65_9RICK|nr:hypothetical protein [Candidatus Megaera venefica]MEA0970392.1 hypothetical protein [Candidatus Megaera venefica]